MRRTLMAFSIVLVCSGYASAQGEEEIIQRGDANTDTNVDVSDLVFISDYVQNNGPAPTCGNQADVDDDGDIDTNDATYLGAWLYSGGPPPPAPGPFGTVCTADSEPYVGCNESPCP